MNNFIDKIEDFFFDFLGLVLPGVIFILLISTPTFFFDVNQLKSLLGNSRIVMLLYNISQFSIYFKGQPTELVITLTLLLAYVLGHLIKVLSIIQYSFLVAFFDNFLIGIINWLVNKLPRIENKIIKDLLHPFKDLLSKIFTFDSSNYFSDNEALKTICIKSINDKLGMNFPDKWYSLYKFSSALHKQENIKSMSMTFLAKYNFYRSLAFCFSVILFYYLLVFNETSTLMSEAMKSGQNFIIVLISLLWFTFHYKYKRYWTLCGNETLVSLFYFMSKNKIKNE